jgi:hypothetical protein
VQVVEQWVLDKCLFRVNKDLVEMVDKELYSKLKPLVGNSRQWNNFSNYIDAMIETHRKTLEQSNDITDIARAQGSITALRKVQRLRDEVSELDG